jgi:toxin ParE1/3/4
MASRKSRTLPIFRKDFQSAIIWSEKHFGAAASDRYRVLVRQALRDVFEDPRRAGVMTRPELARDIYVYHLRFSRDRVSGQPVKSPRHMIVYRYAGEMVEYARLLHDGRDLERHLPTGYKNF